MLRIGFGVLLVLTVLLSACNRKNELVYSVTGTASEAEVSYRKMGVDAETITETVTLPWELELEAGDTFSYALSVTRQAGTPGTVGCEVVINERRMTAVSDALVFAECAGTYRRQGGTTEGRSNSRKDSPELVEAVLASEIEIALAEGLPPVELVALTPYQHDRRCPPGQGNMVKTNFSLMIPEWDTVEICPYDEERQDSNYLLVENGDANWKVALSWYEHPHDIDIAIERGWELLESTAQEAQEAGNRARIQSAALSHQGRDVPFADYLRGNVFERIVLLPGQDGSGMALSMTRPIRGSAAEVYSELDTLTRKMLESLVIDPSLSQVVNLTLTNILDGGTPLADFMRGQDFYVPEGISDLHLALEVGEFTPEIDLGITWYQGDSVLHQETFSWGDRAAEGWHAFALPETLELGHYRFSVQVSGATTANVFAWVDESSDTFEMDFVVGDSERVYRNTILDLFEAGNTEAAIAEAEKGLLLYPDSADIRNNLGYVYRLSERPAEAIPVLERAIELDPRYANPHYQLAIILEDTDLERAIEHYGSVIAYAGDPGLLHFAHRRRGYAHYRAGQTAAALADLEQAFELDTSATGVLFDHAILALELEQFELAIQNLTTLLDIDSEAPWWRFQRGITYEAMGERALAFADYEQVPQFTDDPDLIRRAEAGMRRVED